MARVELRPIPSKEQPWHGKTGEESFKVPSKCDVLVNADTNTYATGLTDAEAKEYGAILGLDLSNKFDRSTIHPTWTSNAFTIILGEATQVFDTTKPRDFVKVKILKASKLVANSMKEYEMGEFPYATHVIDDEQQEMERKASKIESKTMAWELMPKLSMEDKCDIIQILRNKSLRNKPASFVNVEIDEIINENAAEFIKFAKMNKETTFIHALIKEALYRNVLTKEGNAIHFMGDFLAASEDDAITYFKDPNQQRLKATIIGKMGGSRVSVKTNTDETKETKQAERQEGNVLIKEEFLSVDTK